MITKIRQLLDIQERVVVGIDGHSGSGKSTLATRVALIYGANLIHMDDFYLPHSARTPERMDAPGGNIDLDRLIREVALPLQRGERLRYRVFDCAVQDYVRTVEFVPGRVTIIEGSYSMLPGLAEIYDLKVFMRISEAEQRRRILVREDENAGSFLSEWIPRENRYFEALDIANTCDIIVEA